MLDAYAHGEALRLEQGMPRPEGGLDPGEHGVDVPRRVSGRENYRGRPKFLYVAIPESPDARDGATLQEKIRAAGAENKAPPVFANRRAHAVDDPGKEIRADVGMGVRQDRVLRAVIMEDGEDAVRIAALIGACEEFAVRKGSGPALAEAIVRFRVYPLIPGDVGDVAFSLRGFESPLDHDGGNAPFEESKGRE